jgi:DeoR/GlpR family transcriptional regulator of sugar metabolism
MTKTETSGGRRLLASVRRNALMQLIERHGSIMVNDMAAQLQVSEMTIRRDLDFLAEAGRISRDHGGATGLAARPTIDRDEPAFELRGRTNSEAKAAIGRAAAELVKPGDTIGIDTGSTTHCVAEALLPKAGLRLFSSNLRTAAMLAGGASPVYSLGGLIRPRELSVYGPVTSTQLRTLWLDTVFIGISGLIEAGLFDYSLEDSEIKRVFIERANQVVVLCDASKFGRRSLMLVAELGHIHVLVTDRAPPDPLAEALDRAGVRIILAGVPDRGGAPAPLHRRIPSEAHNV